ncbi:MAG: helix-turn-helix domain-containing protein [Bacteroidetes bacterium]|nr:helix-turn-helix domain-containing protein [Bacteroidota bacterium]
MDLQFNDLPKAVTELQQTVNEIKQLILQRSAVLPIEAEQLFTIKQAAEFLNLSVPTIYSYVQRAGIPVSKRQKRLYFSKKELLDWVKEGRKKTLSEIEEEANSRIKRNSL